MAIARQPGILERWENKNASLQEKHIDIHSELWWFAWVFFLTSNYLFQFRKSLISQSLLFKWILAVPKAAPQVARRSWSSSESGTIFNNKMINRYFWLTLCGIQKKRQACCRASKVFHLRVSHSQHVGKWWLELWCTWWRSSVRVVCKQSRPPR